MARPDIANGNSVNVDFSSVDNILKFNMLYDKDQDILFLGPDKPRPATSVDWNGELWLRVDIQTGEIVGLEIDDFEGFFLRKHPEIAKAWEEERPSATLPERLGAVGKARSHKDISSEPLVRIITNFLMSLFRSTPCQPSLDPSVA